MYYKKRIEIVLDETEYEFSKWMAKRDGVSMSEELKMYFYTEFEQCKNLYMGEMKDEQSKENKGI